MGADRSGGLGGTNDDGLDNGAGDQGYDVRLRLQRDPRADAVAHLSGPASWPRRLTEVRKEGTGGLSAP